MRQNYGLGSTLHTGSLVGSAYQECLFYYVTWCFTRPVLLYGTRFWLATRRYFIIRYAVFISYKTACVRSESDESGAILKTVTQRGHNHFETVTQWGHYHFETVTQWGHYHFETVTQWGHYHFETVTQWGHYYFGTVTQWGHYHFETVTQWGHYYFGTVTQWGHYQPLDGDFTVCLFP